MRCKIIITIGLLAGCICVFSFSQEKKEKKETGKLLHTELLQFDRPPLKKSIRNIFVPFQGRSRKRVPGGQPGGPGAGPESGEAQGGEGGPAGPAGESPSSSLPRIDLKYIGYVGTEDRKVALIFRGGEALAVKSDEILPDGVKIIRISSEKVEVELPGGENIEFSLEGDEK